MLSMRDLVRRLSTSGLGALALAFTLAITAGPRSVGAQTVYLDEFPSDDSWIFSNSPTANYGSNSYCSMGDFGISEAGVIVLEYNVTDIPTNATVTDASLTFQKTVTDFSGTIDVRINKVTQTWDESWVTWDNPSPSWVLYETFVEYTQLNTDLNYPIIATSSALVELVQGWVSNPSSNHGLALLEVDNQQGYISFRTTEQGAGNGIQLHVVANVLAPPGPFNLVSPTHGATFSSGTTSVTLDWEDSSNATSYDIYFGTSTSPPYYTNTSESSTSVSVGDGNTYYWKVKANNSEGNTWASSGTWSFSVADCPLPGAFSLVSPTNGAQLGSGTSQVDLDWQNSSGATSYGVSFGTSASPPHYTSTSYSPIPVSVSDGHTYYWRISASNGCGTTWSSSGTWSFSVASSSISIFADGFESGDTSSWSVTVTPLINPVAHYDFESGTGSALVDRTGNGHNGTIGGGSTWISSSIAGGTSALLFDGSTGYVEVPGSQDLYPGNHSYSIAVWFKTSATGVTQAIVHNQYSWNHDSVMLQVSSSNTGVWGFHDYNNGFPCWAETSQVITDGQWHHLVGVRDRASTVSRIYLDGQLALEVSDTDADVEIPLEYELNIGRRGNVNHERYFNGIIDELKIYDFALSETEVTLMYISEGS